MSTELTFPIGRFPQAIRFVLVNNRVPRTDNCALCIDWESTVGAEAGGHPREGTL